MYVYKKPKCTHQTHTHTHTHTHQIQTNILHIHNALRLLCSHAPHTVQTLSNPTHTHTHAHTHTSQTLFPDRFPVLSALIPDANHQNKSFRGKLFFFSSFFVSFLCESRHVPSASRPSVAGMLITTLTARRGGGGGGGGDLKVVPLTRQRNTESGRGDTTNMDQVL